VSGIPMLQTFTLRGVACRFGGLRWFAICPYTGTNVAKLYSVGTRGFQSRRAHGVAYRCQNESRLFDRAIRQRNNVLDKLGANDPEFQPRPKWMRQRTYERLQARLRRYQGACYAGIAVQLQAWGSGVDPQIVNRTIANARGALKKRRR
jgi:hypothetical protein